MVITLNASCTSSAEPDKSISTQWRSPLFNHIGARFQPQLVRMINMDRLTDTNPLWLWILAAIFPFPPLSFPLLSFTFAFPFLGLLTVPLLLPPPLARQVEYLFRESGKLEGLVYCGGWVTVVAIIGDRDWIRGELGPAARTVATRSGPLIPLFQGRYSGCAGAGK